MSGGYFATCFGKEAFDDRRVADKVVKRLKRRRPAINVYRCKACHKWHIGGAEAKKTITQEGKRYLAKQEKRYVGND